MNKTLLNEIVSRLVARANCEKTGNAEWLSKHTAALIELAKDLPSGSGIDRGTKIDLEASSQNRLVLTLGYHHMNNVGIYDGWTEHKIIVTPDLLFGFNLRITGRDRNQIKEYLHDVYSQALNTETVPAAVIA